jgi:3-phenylpropionate/trans-cinnamate dioxygenase ferredoxin reductase subunit
MDRQRFAASARQRVGVALIDPLELPAGRLFGAEVGVFYRESTPSTASSFAPRRVRQTRARRRFAVNISTSGKTGGDFVVVGTGSPPVDRQRGGIKTDNGIVVDGGCAALPRTCSLPGRRQRVAAFYRQQIRVEHWANALNQGPPRAPCSGTGRHGAPYFFSGQYEGSDGALAARPIDDVGSGAAARAASSWRSGCRTAA